MVVRIKDKVWPFSCKTQLPGRNNAKESLALQMEEWEPKGEME